MKKNKVVFNDVDDFTISKAADIIENFGSMWVSQKIRGAHVGYGIFITARSEDEEDIAFLYKMFGGYKYKQIKDEKVYHWFNAQGSRVKMILELVQNELVRDKDLADLILELCRKVNRRNKCRLTDKEKQERVDLFNQIKSKYRKFKPETDNSGVLTESGEHQDTAENDIDL